jgi:hypothetical protein
MPGPGSSSSSSRGESACRLQLKQLAANLDADALLCTVGVTEGIVSLKALLPASVQQAGPASAFAGQGEAGLGADPGTLNFMSELDQPQQPPLPSGLAGAATAGGSSSSLGEPPDAVDIASLNRQRRTSLGEAGALPSATTAAAAQGGPGSKPCRPAWLLEWDQCSVALPLSPELEVALDLGPAAARWQHLEGALALQSTALLINGAP